LIPDVDACAARNARGKLNRRIADDDIAADSRVGRRRKNDDPVRVAVGGVFLDEIIVTREDPDAEIVVGNRVAVSSRLVPPERVVASLDSYAAAGDGRGGVPVPDRHI
jgi:hypothetical protein